MMLLETIRSCYNKLLLQHDLDLNVYQMSHTVLCNRILHWVMVPIETLSFIILLYSLMAFLIIRLLVSEKQFASKDNRWNYLPGFKQSSLTSTKGMSSILRHLLSTVGVFLGSLSFMVSTDLVGFFSLLVHIMPIQWILKVEYSILSQNFSLQRKVNLIQRHHLDLMYFSAINTVVSWTLQVCVGHWILEKNNPSLISNTNLISMLAILQPIVIAWKS
jgi:Protein of unknown function (DUF962)